MTSTRSLFLALCVMTLSAVSWAQSYPPVWNSSAHYVTGDQVQMGGNVFRCIYPVTRANLSPTKAYSFWELADVRVNTTLPIGSGEPFPTLTAAWNYALNATIAGSAHLTFDIVTSHGAYVQTLATAGFSLDHPFGAHISITSDSQVGNEFFVPTASKGFLIDSGHTIASISNLQIVGSNDAANGISASGNATIGMISNCYVNGFVTWMERPSPWTSSSPSRAPLFPFGVSRWRPRRVAESICREPSSMAPATPTTATQACQHPPADGSMLRDARLELAVTGFRLQTSATLT